MTNLFISTFFVPSLPVSPVVFSLNLHESWLLLAGKSVIALTLFEAGSSL